ncbi:hypothetical protein [Rhizobium grahamii]|uniref:hypothetical protein n=1 Tax=Rhizobium grahamii TaxID=1120045 RepID=UPI0003073A94|nr:hypothetical protein [Rhizobium grahamii]
MNKFIIAAAFAVSSFAVTAAPSYADSVTIRIGEPGYHGHSSNRYYDNRYYRDRDRHHVRYDRCWKQPYQVRSHHHEITKYRTVCR